MGFFEDLDKPNNNNQVKDYSGLYIVLVLLIIGTAFYFLITGK
jgi:hypothetical protein